MCIKSDRTDGGSKTLMHAFDRFEDTDLHEKKPKKAKLGKQASVCRTQQAINFYEMKPIKFVRILQGKKRRLSLY